MTDNTRFNSRKWLQNWLILLACILLAFVAGVGLDTTSGSIDLFEGFGTFLDVFGGILSFGAVLGILLIGGGIFWVLRYMTKTDFTHHKGREWACIISMVTAIFVIGLIGWSWVEMPSGMGWSTLIVVIVTAFIAAAFRNVRTPRLTATRTSKSRIRKLLPFLDRRRNTIPAPAPANTPRPAGLS